MYVIERRFNRWVQRFCEVYVRVFIPNPPLVVTPQSIRFQIQRRFCMWFQTQGMFQWVISTHKFRTNIVWISSVRINVSGVAVCTCHSYTLRHSRQPTNVFRRTTFPACEVSHFPIDPCQSFFVSHRYTRYMRMFLYTFISDVCARMTRPNIGTIFGLPLSIKM